MAYSSMPLCLPPVRAMGTHMSKFTTYDYPQSVWSSHCGNETHTRNRHRHNPSSSVLSSRTCGTSLDISSYHAPTSHTRNTCLDNLSRSVLLPHKSNTYLDSHPSDALFGHKHRSRSGSRAHNDQRDRNSSICLDNLQICGRLRHRPSIRSDNQKSRDLAHRRCSSSIARYLGRQLLETLPVRSHCRTA
jgi:hypothetical protein